MAAAMGAVLVCAVPQPASAAKAVAEAEPPESTDVVQAPAPPLTPQDRLWYQKAFEAADRSRWELARQYAGNASEKLPLKAIEWAYYQRRGNHAGFHRIAAFLASNPDWPSEEALRRRAEEAMTSRLDDETVLAWFSHWPPLTGLGQMRLAEALLNTGQTEAGLTMLRDAWVHHLFTRKESRAIYRRHKTLLRQQDHIARLDTLLWNGHRNAANGMLSLVPAEYRRLAEARMALMSRHGDVDRLIAAVPAELRDDPGLTYERARWRRRANLDDGAADLLLQISGAPGPRADKWWFERAVQARNLLAEGKLEEAYRLASDHGLTPGGEDYAEAEWLAGWIALRFRNDPAAAYDHFSRLYKAVNFPVSLARAAYWAGCAAAGNQDLALARHWFAIGAGYPTTFYGQLAAEAAAADSDAAWALPVDPEPDAAYVDAFEHRELVRLIRLLGDIGVTDWAGDFLRHLSETATSPQDHILITGLAADIGRPELAVRAAKAAVRDGVGAYGSGYPLIATPDHDAEPALILAMVRQESEFNAGAHSSAGARGLMQLMPRTARRVARHERVRFRHQQLHDPAYNLRLGSALLGDLIDRYDGSYVLAIAAYNAGTTRVSHWLRQFGDPRKAGTDVIDWIEQIPIYETRNYVQRVMENLQVYRALLANDGPALALSQDLQRSDRTQAKSF